MSSYQAAENFVAANVIPLLDHADFRSKRVTAEFIVKSVINLLAEDGFKCTNQYSSRGRNLAESGGGNYGFAIIMVLVCLICAALASGLTQGLLSLDLMEMKIKARSGSAQEREWALQVIPVITRHHLLLVTLMLWNAAANEALPIFLNLLVPEWMSVLLSVTMVLFVGEIIPAAVLTGPHQLSLAAKLLPLVFIVLVLFFPIAFPIALILDKWLGHDDEVTMYNRKEIATMMSIQHEAGKRRATLCQDTVQQEEVNIVGGALKFRDMFVREVMTPVDKVFMLPASERLNYKTLSEIFKSGFSRIPVYGNNRHDIIGLILTKDLIFVDPEDETSINNFVSLFGRKPAVVWHDQTLGDTLSIFRQGRSHMAIVRDVNDEGPGDPFYEVVGIITLEDIIEEILGTEIEDETDNTGAPRDMELARLKLMNGKMADDHLSPEEVKAVAAHLLTNVPQIRALFGENMGNQDEGVRQLVSHCAVLDLRRASNETHKPQQEDMLYRRGKMSNSCLLLLSGKVAVLAGKDAFLSELGPWTTIAADSLISSDGSYIPDFSAYVCSESVRALRLSIHSVEACGISSLQKRKEELGILSEGMHARHDRRRHRLERSRMRFSHPSDRRSPSPARARSDDEGLQSGYGLASMSDADDDLARSEEGSRSGGSGRINTKANNQPRQTASAPRHHHMSDARTMRRVLTPIGLRASIQRTPQPLFSAELLDSPTGVVSSSDRNSFARDLMDTSTVNSGDSSGTVISPIHLHLHQHQQHSLPPAAEDIEETLVTVSDVEDKEHSIGPGNV